VGKYPITAVKYMDRVCVEVDGILANRKRSLKTRLKKFINEQSTKAAIIEAADQLVDEIKAKAIITFSNTGIAPLLLAKHRCSAPIIALTTDSKIAQAMNLYRGVYPIVIKNSDIKKDECLQLFSKQLNELAKQKLLKKGDKIVVISGERLSVNNIIRIETVGF
ncbi:pyruvate kinase alpha/beta domain-containing protein, partial [bacterium]|nr:pyruvate kinase alpha/beta domain-containing protein [bacterium]